MITSPDKDAEGAADRPTVWLAFSVLMDNDAAPRRPAGLTVLLGAYASRRRAETAVADDMELCLRPDMKAAIAALGVLPSHYVKALPVEADLEARRP